MGVSPTWLLRADPLERELIIEVIAETIKFAEMRDRKLANMIIEELAAGMAR